MKIKPLRIYYVLLVCIVLLVFGCRRASNTDFCSSNCYVISGYVTDDSTGAPIDNVNVTIRESDKAFNIRYRDLSDSTGFWKFMFSAEAVESTAHYKLIFSRIGYAPSFLKLTFDSLVVDEETIILNSLIANP